MTFLLKGFFFGSMSVFLGVMYQMAGSEDHISFISAYGRLVGGLLSWKSLMNGIIASVYDNNASNVGSLLF